MWTVIGLSATPSEWLQNFSRKFHISCPCVHTVYSSSDTKSIIIPVEKNTATFQHSMTAVGKTILCYPGHTIWFIVQEMSCMSISFIFGHRNFPA